MTMHGKHRKGIKSILSVERRTLLLVEQDEDERKAIRNYIEAEQLNYDMDEASSLQSARVLLGSRRYDLILMEDTFVSDPVSEMLHVSDKLPVVIVSGNEMACRQVEQERLGISDCIVRGQGQNYFRLLFFAIENIFRKQQAEAALAASEEMFYKLFQSSSVIMVVARVEDSRIIEANDSVFTVTGYSRDEVIGHTTLELDLYPDMNQREEIRKRVSEEGSVRDYELTIRAKNGEYRYGIFSFDLITVDNDLCILAVAYDITQRKLAEDKLKKAYSDLENANEIIEEKARLLEEASRHKSEFLASMSHELRTPLNSVILLSEILVRNSDGHLSDKDIEYADIIRSAGQDLLELINDVLDISKVEAGRMDVNLSEMSFEYLCRKLERYFMEMASVKGLEFTIDQDPSLPYAIITDVQKLEQILKNLIANAMKFTKAGRVSLSIYRPDSNTDLSMIGLDGIDAEEAIAFAVSDTGIGIDEDELAFVFETFRQSKTSISGHYGGSGLGLPISKVFAQLLSGDILVESVVGEGSVFRLYLPEKKVDSAEQDIYDESSGSAGIVTESSLCTDDELVSVIAGKKILIIDDDMRSTYSLISSLEPYQPEIVVASDGNKGLEKLKEHMDTDIVLLDILMPEADGYEFLSDIRSLEVFADLPVIVLTARVSPEDREKSIYLGASEFMTKPVSFEELLNRIARYLTSVSGGDR